MAKKNKEEQYKPQKMQQSVYSKAFDVFNIVFMILFCITILIPFWDMIVRSFSRAQDISFMHVNFFPKVWSIEAYAYCFRDSEILNAMLISVARTVLGTAFHIIVTCLAAYTLTRDQMPFRRIITGILLIPMFFSGGLIPTYINMRTLHLTNNFLVYILPTGFSIYNCIIIRNYFFSIDKGMEEAASIDGASPLQVFVRIVMPLSKPVLATVSLWQIVGQWNSWFDNMIYTRSEAKLTTLQYLLRRMLDTMQKKDAQKHAHPLEKPFLMLLFKVAQQQHISCCRHHCCCLRILKFHIQRLRTGQYQHH